MAFIAWRGVGLFVCGFLITTAIFVASNVETKQNLQRIDKKKDSQETLRDEMADKSFLNYYLDDENGFRVVITVRKGTIGRFLNQAISLRKYSNVSIAVICEDPGDSVFLKQAGFPVVYDTISLQTARFYVRKSNCAKGDPILQIRQAGLVMSKIQYFKKLLNQRRSFLLTDANAVWLKSPTTIASEKHANHGLVFGLDWDEQNSPEDDPLQILKTARPVRFALFQAGRTLRRDLFPKIYAYALMNLCRFAMAENMILAELTSMDIAWSLRETDGVVLSKSQNISVSSLPTEMYNNACKKSTASNLKHAGVIRPACLSGNGDVVAFLKSKNLWFLAEDWQSRPFAKNWRDYTKSISIDPPNLVNHRHQ
eukprot:TRINITY_DN2818_c1_g1_i1.p1 TRINITY_DN2818_c1_g1~~TRINITY_DN2818_c1_g1_i1.p1  ORF type:complete len:368 (-),score=69.29 TRINITY_DN2818_c1_g1_i1:196-1299(-)